MFIVGGGGGGGGGCSFAIPGLQWNSYSFHSALKLVGSSEVVPCRIISVRCLVILNINRKRAKR